MPQPYQLQPQAGSNAGQTVATIDANGNVTSIGSLTVGAGVNGVGMAPGQVYLVNSVPPVNSPVGGAMLYASTSGGLYTKDINGTVSSLVSTLRTGATSWNAIAETINHNAVSQTVIQPASGELQIMSVGIEAGQTISNIGFCTGNTAATGPTHWWAAILDVNRVQLAHSADQTTTAMGSSTWFKLPMTTPYTTTYTGLYYLALMIATSGAQPSILAAQVQGAFVTGTNVPSPSVGGRSTTGLTVPGTDGVTTYAAPTGIGGFYYAYAI